MPVRATPTRSPVGYETEISFVPTQDFSNQTYPGLCSEEPFEGQLRHFSAANVPSAARSCQLGLGSPRFLRLAVGFFDSSTRNKPYFIGFLWSSLFSHPPLPSFSSACLARAALTVRSPLACFGLVLPGFRALRPVDARSGGINGIIGSCAGTGGDGQRDGKRDGQNLRQDHDQGSPTRDRLRGIAHERPKRSQDSRQRPS